ncbi:MAG: SRPBCC domain-containing protein [Bacteroidota bacterium]
MARRNEVVSERTDQDLVISHTYDAPRSLVFRAWTDPALLMQWWAPHGCTTPFCTVDFRPGGLLHYCMRLSDGREIWGRGIYREIVEPERLVYTDSFADAEGNAVSPAAYGMSSSHPAESLVTVTFTEEAGRTTVTLRHSVPESVEEREGMKQGWSEMLERLAGSLVAVRTHK